MEWVWNNYNIIIIRRKSATLVFEPNGGVVRRTSSFERIVADADSQNKCKKNFLLFRKIRRVVIKKTQMSTGLIENRKTAVFLPTKQNT